MHDEFGDRMKSYEATESARTLTPGLPVYVRLDGRSFSKFTKEMRRPYDRKLSYIMVEVTKELAKQFKADLAYTQSDEISLGWVNTNPEIEFMFGGRIQKIVTVLAGIASAKFNQLCMRIDAKFCERAINLVPSFDARIFQVPSTMELMNAFLWREQDGRRNAISMAAQSRYSHKQLQGVKTKQMLEMMAADGVDYDEFYPQFFRVGTYINRVVELKPVPECVPVQFKEQNGGFFLRSSYKRMKVIPSTTVDRMLQWFGVDIDVFDLEVA